MLIHLISSVSAFVTFAVIFRSRRDSDAPAAAMMVGAVVAIGVAGLICIRRSSRPESVRMLRVIEERAWNALKRRTKETGEHEPDLFKTSR